MALELKKSVVVGLSGGVDSAVAAYLLKKRGYQIIAVFMRNWDSELNNDYLGNKERKKQICPQENDYNDAKKVAKKLEIPLVRVDFIKEYWDEVFQDLIKGYQEGFTPNPDIWCNKKIKFGHLLNYALKDLKADFIATGHYAKIIEGKLFKGVDSDKDQSYFLSQVSKDSLKKIIFPLGEFTKKEVRKIAKKINLEIAEKPDSVGICFIGKRNFSSFLNNYLTPKKGDIIHQESGIKIGSHNGAFSFTIGQRKGLNVGGLKTPVFVTKKDVRRNVLYVAYKEEKKLRCKYLTIEQFNLLAEPKNWDNLTAKIRYRSPELMIKVEFLEASFKKLRIEFKEEAFAVAPGQHLVIYENNLCIGGGVINDVINPV